MAVMDTQITGVTVYTDRARVTRKGIIHLGAGQHSLTVSGLPTTLQDDSVRAAGRGTHAKIVGLDVLRRFVTEAPEADMASRKRELEALQDSEQELAATDNLYAAQHNFLEELRDQSSKNLPRGIALGKTGIESIAALNDYISKEVAAIQEQRRNVAIQRRELAREIEAKQRLLNTRYDTTERREIVVNVETTEETDLELEVIYSVVNASWRPLYDIRLDDKQVSLIYLANVMQQTGEDWDNVRLSLSTARPGVSSTIPELHPWFLDILRPPVALPPVAPVKRAAHSGVGQPSDAMMAMSFAAESAPVAEVMQAEVESSGASVTFNVPRPVSILADGTPHKTTVTNLDLEAHLDYVTVPRMAEEAYLRAKIKNNSEVTLLAGDANIFHAGSFVGKTFLETVAPNEEFEAQLGVDDRVKVKRELAERTAAKTFIGNTRRTGLGYRITVTNHLSWPAQVTVCDQIPVSRHENVKVKLTEVSPEPAEHTDLNILKWELNLPPGGKSIVSYSFMVENPRDVRVTGLRE